MVQRKVANKLGIQVDHVKSEKLLVNLRPSSPRQGADLKTKKMKKSRPIKRSDFESSRSSPPLRKDGPRPGKPQTLDVPTAAAIPQKQSPIKAQEASPNYMKSTSSFDARKERSPVSTRLSLTSNATKTPSPTNSINLKHGSASVHKAAKTLTWASSLKLVKTLTKTPSFKPARPTVRKFSPVALCEDLDSQRATCSSTLKDSKFPNYLTLSPGGTESEGTSVMKVCPYTYCSLNGHYHTPSPPLKCFLSARRHMLRMQKNVKLGSLSPRRAKSSADSKKENDVGQMIFADKPPIQEEDLHTAQIPAIKQEEQTDFFIEIYTNIMEDTAEAIGGSQYNKDDADTCNLAVTDIMPSAGTGDQTATEDSSNDKIAHSHSDNITSEIDIGENPNRNGDVILTETIISEFLPEESQKVQATEELYPSPLAQEETTVEFLADHCNSDEEIQPKIQMDEQNSDVSDMEWEAQQLSAPHLDDILLFKSDNIAKETLADGVLHELFDEESISSEAWIHDSDSDLEDSYANGESHASDGIMRTKTTWPPMKDSTAEVNNSIPKMVLRLEHDETKFTSENQDEAFVKDQENVSLEDGYTCQLLGNREPNSPHDATRKDQEGIYKDHMESQNTIEVYQSNAVTEREFSNKVFDGCFLQELPPADDSEPDQDSLVQEPLTADARYGMEEKEKEEVHEEKTRGDNDECKLSEKIGDSESSITFADEAIPAQVQDHSTDKQPQINVVEKQDETEKARDEAERSKISNSTAPEAQTESGIAVTSAENTNTDQDAKKMEVEYASKPDAEEICSTPKTTSSRDTNYLLFHARSTSHQELPKADKIPGWTIGCRRPLKDAEVTKKFGMRDPNYLPVEPEPEAERVDLRHEMMDDRKNAEEWMMDFALRRAVTKLAPARKRKVALLVEAFETVLPTPKYEMHPRHTPAAFVHARPLQACRSS
ncbi:hypothetical protein RJ639_013999 [Escallonia herrerae]|uniref:Calmodulin-binding domain-containing protein n=1 Tax=Escallonia herrerae TaxID=1293975 RepID=A0AA89AM43_9ASTE|nr:hypothetical protein RJ639_013999 [Escallonia herrerae]